MTVTHTLHFSFEVFGTQKECKQKVSEVIRRIQSKVGVLLVDEYPLIENPRVKYTFDENLHNSSTRRNSSLS